uniref:Uncharacterized protein n=1 Tax=Arundo donax TaxID=35708 RepID=A0A0A9ERZ9_ARUDO
MGAFLDPSHISPSKRVVSSLLQRGVPVPAHNVVTPIFRHTN